MARGVDGTSPRPSACWVAPLVHGRRSRPDSRTPSGTSVGEGGDRYKVVIEL